MQRVVSAGVASASSEQLGALIYVKVRMVAAWRMEAWVLVAVGPALTAERHRGHGTPNGLGGRP